MSIVGKLLLALEAAQVDGTAMDNQLNRIKDRLRAGVGTDGRAFEPYAGPPKPGQQRPLVAGGAKLIDAATVGAFTSLDCAGVAATIEGQAGVIAAAQNKMRPFAGYSDNDTRQVVEDFLSVVKKSAV